MINVVVMSYTPPHITSEDRLMVTPKVTELCRLSAHKRQVAYVRASLLRGIRYDRQAGHPAEAKR
jgi:hypothetical protein